MGESTAASAEIPQAAGSRMLGAPMAIDTIPHRLLAQAAARPDAPAYHHKVDGRYRGVTWAEYAATVRKAAKALVALGFERGSKVSILGFNRAEWVIFDVAAMTAGG